jgi:uncharacterized membrane protein YhaH (DUF805 family)
MDFATAVRTVLMEKYMKFDGRARRSEYWWYVLAIVIVALILALIDNLVLGVSLLGGIWSLATLLPSLAVAIRRLHDLDKSGWWLLLAFVPIVGGLVLLYWFCQPGTPGDNQFGPPAA